MAALCMAQKLGKCDEAVLHAFIGRQVGLASLADAPRAAALAMTHEILEAAEGFDTLLDMLANSLSAAQSATAYILCADFIAQNGTVSPEEMRFLERLGEALDIDRLNRAAFDQAAQARGARLTGDSDG